MASGVSNKLTGQVGEHLVSAVLGTLGYYPRRRRHPPAVVTHHGRQRPPQPVLHWRGGGCDWPPWRA